MAESGAIIGLPAWLDTPAGARLLEWEQQHLDEVVTDIFGFHALQLGLPRIDALRANRMPHRWLAVENPAEAAACEGQAALRAVSLHCDFDALPFDSASLDLVVLPHTLEFARDPHLALREVERVLMPEGRVVIVGFNPASLWGLRERAERWRRRLRRRHADALQTGGSPLGYRRLRDWLRLLSFEVEAGRFGGYVPPVASAKWLARLGWMERAGDRWWPIFGAVYVVTAVKRVRGMRLVGLIGAPRRKPVPVAAPVAAAHQHEFESGPDAR
ncbi:class I SAM-dependent methyltransferase [Piscinibacter koreensis]|uniref:Class I SAM-dependent methyltransferase n=1 Tax=Piscinibacter koreensis TaxID=2742824 RepID=A0A7Y6TY42_9BURK|nr:methyltransferase domain-containing protein [Schlegelella koreensis]NUZ07727.1 class I SAM-dependent methyltransferase [Schlegelella koreensis]